MTNRSLRIVLNAWFIDRPNTGSGQYLAHLLESYAACNSNDRFLLCGRADQTPPKVVSEHAEQFAWCTVRTPFDSIHPHLAKVWFEQVSFPLACRSWRADLAHVPYWASPLFSTVPTIVTVHDLVPLLLPAYAGGWLGRLYTRLVAASARRAAYVLTDSQASRDDITTHLDIPASHVSVIHLGVERRFHPISDRDRLNEVVQKYALPNHYLLYLGGFDVRKNVPNILRAFAQLDLAPHKLVIAGKLPDSDTPFFPDPCRIVDELGIADRVHLTGWIDEDDKPALYSGATAFVFPSQYEGFGLSPVEAMACGIPVIVSNKSSLPQIVGHGGLLVDPDNPSEIADGMRQLLTDRSLYERLGKAALEQASHFDWKHTARQTLVAYRRTASATEQ